MKHPQLLPLPDIVQERINVARDLTPGRWCVVAKYDDAHPLAATLVWHIGLVAATIYGADVQCGRLPTGHLAVCIRFEPATITYPQGLN